MFYLLKGDYKVQDLVFRLIGLRLDGISTKSWHLCGGVLRGFAQNFFSTVGRLGALSIASGVLEIVWFQGFHQLLNQLGVQVLDKVPVISDFAGVHKFLGAG